MDNIKEIIIGSTGDYRADGLEPIYKIWIKNKYGNLNGVVLTDADLQDLNNQLGNGASILYQYDSEIKNIFNSVEKIKTKVGESFQQIGATKKDLISDMSTAKEEITFIGMSNYFKRPVERLYYKNFELEEKNIFYDLNKNNENFRKLKEQYNWKLSWDPQMFNPASSLNAGFYQKKKNSNGLSEDWWDMRDWATYYAKCKIIKDKQNIDIIKLMNLADWYPKLDVKNYMEIDADGCPTPAQIESMLGIPADETSRIYGNIQIIIQNNDTGEWTAIRADVPEENPKIFMYDWFLNSQNVAENKTAYIYKPAFEGEKVFIENEDTYNLLVYLNYDVNEFFDDEESMHYSPFSIYVLKNSEIPVGKQKKDISKHLDWDLYNIIKIVITDKEFKAGKLESVDENISKYTNQNGIEYLIAISLEDILKYNRATKDGDIIISIVKGSDINDGVFKPCPESYKEAHMFERYYIDRYIAATSVQEELEIYSNAYEKYLSLDDSDSNKQLIGEWLNNNQVFVLDAWTGNIYQVGENWLYEPFIIYNEEKIDLREIERYNLDGLYPEDTNIQVGNGVWADIYYQEVEKTYSFEKEASHYEDWVDAKEKAQKNKHSMLVLQEEKDMYKIFDSELQELINTYTEKEV